MYEEKIEYPPHTGSLPLLKYFVILVLFNHLPWQIPMPFSVKTSTGKSVLIQGVEFGFVNVSFPNILCPQT